MRVKDNLLPRRLYCWLFEHDDVFVHESDDLNQYHHWCQRCFVQLTPPPARRFSRRKTPDSEVR